MAIPSFSSTVVARAAASLYGLQLGYGTMAQVLAEANQNGGIGAVINAVYNRDFGNMTDAAVAAAVVQNLGISAGKQDAIDYLVAALAAAPAGAKGAAVTEAVSLFSGLADNPTYASAVAAFNGRIAAAVAYSQQAGTVDRAIVAGANISLTLNQDFLSGTGGDDTIVARIISGTNSLQDADWVDGGAGYDTLTADMGWQAFAVTPETTNVEKFAVRAQARSNDSGDNNTSGPQVVKVDAQRMVGVNWYESSNSRADAIVEDVRILDSQITKDVTIAFVESDPGNVDFGVYFDQYSLRNQVSASSSINLKVMDTVATQKGEAPLLNANVAGFKFTVTINGVATVLDLKSDAIQAAKTYAELAAAFQVALDGKLGAGAATATVGENFTVIDPDSKAGVTGQTVVLTTKSAATFTTPEGSGWLTEGVVPPQSNIYTNYTTGSTTSASLVTSTIVLDDVGRGSTGGDLVVGGLSVGDTSSSKGVQRFEIEVRDNSKLQSINSTNNTLREVVLTNGLTSSNSHAYVDTVKDAGKLTVLGAQSTNGANLFTAGTGSTTLTGAEAAAIQTGIAAPLPGTNATENSYGFTDVRLIDGSAMRGELTFSAQVTEASVGKYLNLKDIQALPAGDNIDFVYSGGAAKDTMYVRINTAAASSRDTILPGREDFTFTANGGAGDDTLNVSISGGSANPNLIGGTQAWYTNQKLNANITVNGGDGNDTIRTPGAGDFKINGGSGNDTVYADNTGKQTITWNSGNGAGAAYQAAEAAELAAALALATLQNNTDAGKTQNVVNELIALDLTTPVEWNDPAAPTAGLDPQPLKADIQTAIDTALANRAISIAQAQALATAYNTSAVGTTTTPNNPGALTEPVYTPGAPVVTNLTLSEFNAGNALLATYLAAAKAAAAEAAAAEANWAAQLTLLNTTQQAVINGTLATNGAATAETIGEGDVIGTATQLAALQTLKSSLVVGASDVQVVAAITAAWKAGAFGDPDVVLLTDPAPQNIGLAAISSGAGNMTAPEVAEVGLQLDLLINTANNLNTAANTALGNAIDDNNAAVELASNQVGADPVNAGLEAVLEDAVGSTETAAAVTTAKGVLKAFTDGALADALDVQSGLAALKGALTIGTTELQARILLDNAEANGVLGAGDANILYALVSGAPPVANGAIDNTEKQNLDEAISALQVVADRTVAVDLLVQANLQAVVDATTLAAAKAKEAAEAGLPNDSLGTVNTNAVWVFNTANQKAVTTTPGTGYVLAVNDERAVRDLKSDANNNYNFFNSELTVTFKGITSTVDVPNTGYKTSDLQVNQAIKNAINNDPVLSKLLLAEDGPANTLKVTSLIDGKMSNANIGVAIELPIAGSLNSVEIAGAAAAYGLPAASTEAAVLTAMNTAWTGFNTKGDYVDQLAETGAAAGNTEVAGAPSITTSDNTINPGDGNDVIVLGTTSGLEALLSSNDTVVYQPAFGHDTIVHFKAGSLETGGDVLNLSALGGSTLTTLFNLNKSINVADEAAGVNDTEELVAALYADSATAQTHVYVAVDTTTNIGTLYQVVDAAGTGAGSVTATVAGTIDLADTLWSTLTVVNFS